MERKRVEIEISRHREKPGTYVARYRSPVLGAVYSVEFPDSVTGAVALHHFAEMLKTRYPADGATRFVFVSTDAKATDTLRDAAAMGTWASQEHK